jgi:hypothetical protein
MITIEASIIWGSFLKHWNWHVAALHHFIRINGCFFEKCISAYGTLQILTFNEI